MVTFDSSVVFPRKPAYVPAIPTPAARKRSVPARTPLPVSARKSHSPIQEAAGGGVTGAGADAAIGAGGWVADGVGGGA